VGLLPGAAAARGDSRPAQPLHVIEQVLAVGLADDLAEYVAKQANVPAHRCRHILAVGVPAHGASVACSRPAAQTHPNDGSCWACQRPPPARLRAPPALLAPALLRRLSLVGQAAPRASGSRRAVSWDVSLDWCICVIRSSLSRSPRCLTG